MKMTLLEMTQSILSSLSSDEVNSISDTTESQQVAEILKQTYFNIISRTALPAHKQTIQLDPSLDITMPVMMYVPENIGKVEWLKYFNTNNDAGGPEPGYEYVTILPIQQFIDMVNQYNPEETNVQSFTFTPDINGQAGDYTFYYKDDRTPSYCTIISNYYVIFDSYDSTQDSTLQSSKTMAYGQVIPVWQPDDDFIPNLNDEQFMLLLNEAKSLAFFELKQMAHPKAEREAQRGWTAIQRKKYVADKPTDFDALPNFGRSGVYGPFTALQPWR